VAHAIDVCLDDGRQLLARYSDTLMRVIDLHFHDLRHECAMRWLKRGYGLNTSPPCLATATSTR
jgi:hypothetical protein